MNRTCLAAAILLLSITTVHASSGLAKLPLSFEENRGQAPAAARFVARGDGYSIVLGITGNEVLLRHKGESMSIGFHLAHADAGGNIRGEKELQSKVNYLRGLDSAAWFSQIPTFERVRYTNVYPHIDVSYYGSASKLEYDFIVSPGGDPKFIGIAFDRVDRLAVDAGGNLHVISGKSEIIQPPPIVYQMSSTGRRVVQGSYRLLDKNTVGFKIGSYDRSSTLLIDPILSYSTFLGGSDGNENANAIATDASGNIYIAGSTTSTDFPTAGSLQSASSSSDPTLNLSDGFISKLNATGTALIYSTYFGGSGGDVIASLAVDAGGNVVVAGTTNSTDFPTTAGALRRTCNIGSDGSCADAFIARLNPTGSALVFSTYLGGNGDDAARSVALDPSGNIYVAGETTSTNFPVTAGAFSSDSSQGGFVTKLTPAGGLVYSTYFGAGAGTTQVQGIAVDSAGNAYVTGSTPSSSQTATDVFVTKLNAAGTGASYSSSIRGSNDEAGTAIAVDTAGNAYVTGHTSSLNFTVKSGAAGPPVLQPTFGGGGPAFATNTAGSPWSSRSSGIARTSLYAVAIAPTSPSTVYIGGDDAIAGGLYQSSSTSTTWTAIGTGITDNRIHALTVDPKTPTTVYAGTRTAGVFKTTNGGASWAATSLNNVFVTKIAIDPITPTTVYAATEGSGLFKSVDAGATWSAINNGLTSTSLRTIVIHPVNTATLYVGSSGGIYLSTDGGATWNPSNSGLFNPDINTLVIDPRNPNLLYVGTNAIGVFRSLNGGSFWLASNGGLTDTGVGILVSAMTMDSSGTLYAAIGQSNVSDVYKSSDGINWTPAGLSTALMTAIAVDPANPTSVYAATVGGSDAFVAKWDPTGALVYSTFLGGYRDDAGNAIAVDSAGNAFITGNTSSKNFPTLGAIQPQFGGGSDAVTDAFVTKINATATALSYSTYLGGSNNDFGNAIALDASGNAYIAGQTGSSDFPTAAPFSTQSALLDAFVARIQNSSTVSYTVAPRGGYTSASQGAAGPLTAGFGSIIPATNSKTPSGLAIFGFRENNVLVTEAAVPATAPISSGRIYVEVAGAVDTGIAIANPNNQPVTITFSGVSQGSATIVANGQIATFLDQAPFNVGGNTVGTLSFTASAPVAVVALRGLTNERGEFLITTLPVLDLSAQPGTGSVLFPHFADGGGWTTKVVLVNPTNSAINGSIQFYTQGNSTTPVQPYTVTAGTQTASSFSYSIPAQGAYELQTAGLAAATQAGSILIVPGSSTPTPVGVAIFSFRKSGVTVSEAGVPATPTGSAFRLYVEASGFFNGGAVGSIQTGVAIANASASAAIVNFELNTLNGVSTGLTGSLTIPGNGQVAMFLGQIPGFLSLPNLLQGVLRISTTSTAGISVVGLRGRYNERGDFLITTTPPSNEAVPASTSDLYFPHIVDGGGYTTQFVLFNGSTDQLSSGTVLFFTQSGQIFNLSIR